MAVHADRIPSQEPPCLRPLPHASARRSDAARRCRTRLAALVVPLVLTLTATPALARFPTAFSESAQIAPLVVRAKVLSITDLPYGQKQVELEVARLISGPYLGRRLTLWAYETEAEILEEGSLYLLTLSGPHTLFDSRNHCGTEFSAQVIDGTVPGFGNNYKNPLTLAAVEETIICKRHPNRRSCLSGDAAASLLGPLTRSQIFFYLGMLALGAYSAWLLRLRRTLSAAAPPAPEVGPISTAAARLLGWLLPPLHR